MSQDHAQSNQRIESGPIIAAIVIVLFGLLAWSARCHAQALSGNPPSNKVLPAAPPKALTAEQVNRLREADELNTKVVQLYRVGRSREALPLAQEGFKIRQQILGLEHQDTAQSLFNLAAQYDAIGEYAKAELQYRQALEVRKRILGENHPDYAKSLNYLGLLYKGQGDFRRAERMLRQALEISKKVLGENHPDYATSLNNLGNLYLVESDYSRGEPLLLQALEIRKKVLGENHPDFAESLNSLGRLYLAESDYSRAEPLLLQALEIRKKVLGENHPDYATSLDNLGILYLVQRDYARAEPLLLQASAICKKVLGENHPEYASCLNHLAARYICQGDYSRAERLLLQASAIWKKALGENHPDYAERLNNLASLYHAEGHKAHTELVYRQILEIQNKVLAENQSDNGVNLNIMTSLFRAQASYARAEPLYRQAASIVRKHLETTAVIQSERQQLAMLQQNRDYLDKYLGLAMDGNYLRSATDSGQYSEPAYRESLAWKGMVVRRNRLARAAAQSPELAANFSHLQCVATELTRLAWATPDPRQEVNWRQRVARLSAEKEQLEADLSARSAEYRQAMRAISLEDLQGALSEDSVLIDFVECQHDLLLAFVVAPGRPVVMVPLGAVQPINEAIETWRVTFGMSAEGARAARLLRERLWAPLEEKLHGAKIVLVLPDGALSRLPFGALPGKRPGSYLIEERVFAVVPVPQLIPQLVQEEGRKQLRKKLLLLGNVDYDATPAQGRIGFQPVSKDPSNRSGDDRRDDASTLFSPSVPSGTLHFGPLPGTESEIAAIEELGRREAGSEGVTTLRKSQAGKEAFLAEARRHGYLHLATHGFCIEEKVRVPVMGSREARPFDEILRGPEAGGTYPALLSGLAMAGANRVAEQQPSPPAPLPSTGEGSDGILTAEEIGTQNLDGVQIVVLSACESGLGKQASGEGLLGLQRSFQSAGARSVVASLWSVDDAATKTLMVAFYTNLWEKKMPKLAALRQAQLTMLREYDPKAGKLRGPGGVRPVDPDKLAAAREAGRKQLSPFYWASFVLSGDWK